MGGSGARPVAFGARAADVLEIADNLTESAHVEIRRYLAGELLMLYALGLCGILA